MNHLSLTSYPSLVDSGIDPKVSRSLGRLYGVFQKKKSLIIQSTV